MSRPSYTVKRAGQIEFSFWLVFSSDGSMRFSRGQPDAGRKERAMSCQATLPASIFQTPELRATIGVTDDAIGPFKIDVEAVASAMRQVVGCDVQLWIKPDLADAAEEPSPLLTAEEGPGRANPLTPKESSSDE